MTAGSIAVPTIIPLRAPHLTRAKTLIDSNTKIEIRSESSNTDIYYTTDGSKPEPYQKLGLGPKVTIKYKFPFLLAAGRRTIKALAAAKEADGRMSNTVTKVFEVEYIEPDPLPQSADNDTQFLDEIESERIHKYPGLKYSTGKKQRHELMAKLLSEGLHSGRQQSGEAWQTNLGSVEMTGADHGQLQRQLTEMSVSGSTARKPRTGTRFLNTRFSTSTSSDHVTIGQDTLANYASVSVRDNPDADPDIAVGGILNSKWRRSVQPPTNSTQTLRLQRETDFLKCVYCFAPRPSDPYARFCNDCGSPVPPLPHTRLLPPEPAQMGQCVHCNSMVPMNTATCVVCEAGLPQQNVPQASIALTDKVICSVCQTVNPPNLNSCITCESRLPLMTKPSYAGHMAPPLPNQEGRLLTCSKCGRVNNSDARFCDWCGSKPGISTNSLICSKCHASNQPYAKFCASCAVQLAPPTRLDPRNSTFSGLVDRAGSSTSNDFADPRWLPVTFPSPQSNPAPTKTTASQTVGLYYPSERELLKKQLIDEDKMALEKQMRDRRPVLTAVSPGRGYWHKQMEHICSHLKAHAQNKTEFRALIGEPRMGKIVSASVHEDGYEVNISVNFSLKGNKDPYDQSRSFNHQTHLEVNSLGGRARHNHGVHDDFDTQSLDSEPSVTHVKSKKRVTTKKTKIRENKDDKMSKEDRLLLKEVGKNGEGRISEVQQLLDEGADPNCVNKEKVPVLLVAVTNQHLDVIPILVQAGARINDVQPIRDNTALHTAISLPPGTTGTVTIKEMVDTLLGCGANPSKKNKKGETPYELAVKLGQDTLVKTLASHMGQSQLDKMMKPRSSGVF